MLILDKPAGPTSRAVVEDVRRLLGARSAGHVGTLDPSATGVLPILLGRATRVAPALERLDKEYTAVVHLHKDVSDSILRSVLGEFVGAVKQRPPVKSAVARRERTRMIYSIEILGRDGNDVRLRIVCEAGTYIRKLASDIGLKIGGAHLKGLRRTRSGPFFEKDARKLDEIKDAAGNSAALAQIVLPVERAVAHLPKVAVADAKKAAVLNGIPIREGWIVERHGNIEKGLIAIFSTGSELLALGRADKNRIKVDRVVATQSAGGEI